MPFRQRDIADLLQNKFGFSPAVGHSSDHLWYELRLPGLPLILTKVSLGRKPASKELESKMARQCRVHRPFFQGMMECTNSREDYYRRVCEAPYPPFEIRF